MKFILYVLSIVGFSSSLVSSRGGFAGLSPPLRTAFATRGGGLFGNNNNKDTSSSTELKDASSALEEAVKQGNNDEGNTATGEKYPALSEGEIEEWLEHIPVFAVTDSSGAGVVLKPENDTSSVFYFFLNPVQANATLQQIKGTNEQMDLKVSTFSLGKIWFPLLKSEKDAEVMLKPPGGDDSTIAPSKGIEYRLVPDSRDLLGARMLLTMSPEDREKLEGSSSMTPEMAQAAVVKAMTESPKFKSTFNEIPVFTIAQMRMQKQQAQDEDEPVTMLPMYFSLQNMIGTWQQFMSQAPADVQGVEPAINLMSLQDIVSMMQKESEIDWRTVVLVPPVSESTAPTAGGGATTVPGADPMAQMGGATLGDE